MIFLVLLITLIKLVVLVKLFVLPQQQVLKYSTFKILLLLSVSEPK